MSNRVNLPSVVSSAFKHAVEQTPDVAKGYRAGLKALEANAGKIQVTDTRLLEGSVDIDACTVAMYPEDNRWDYALSYQGKTCFVEVHPASTSEISTIIKKYEWLRQWLKVNAPKIDSLPKAAPAFYWVQTNGCQILPASRQSRSLAQHGLKPIKMLKL